ncbi:hypothetical protein VU04_10705, partial [Desulfobulbus sp. TB]|nr:hypothetical protein [Desulfobulbus sp. TB]
GNRASSYAPVVRSSPRAMRNYSSQTYVPYTPPIQRSRSYSTTTLPTRYSKPKPYITPTTVRTATKTPATRVTIINTPINRSFTTSRSQFVLPPTIIRDTRVTTVPVRSSRITSHSMINDMPRYDENSNSCPPPLPEPDYCPAPEESCCP